VAEKCFGGHGLKDMLLVDLKEVSKVALLNMCENGESKVMPALANAMVIRTEVLMLF
jgi:hypothetical protein